MCILLLGHCVFPFLTCKNTMNGFQGKVMLNRNLAISASVILNVNAYNAVCLNVFFFSPLFLKKSQQKSHVQIWFCKDTFISFLDLTEIFISRPANCFEPPYWTYNLWWCYVKNHRFAVLFPSVSVIAC